MSALKRPNVFRWHSFSFHWKAFTEAFIALWIRASCPSPCWSLAYEIQWGTLFICQCQAYACLLQFQTSTTSFLVFSTAWLPSDQISGSVLICELLTSLPGDGRPLFFTNKQGFLISLFPGMGICSPGPGYRHRTGEPSSSALILEVVKGFDGGPHPYSRGYWQLSIKAWQPSIKACI